MTGNSVAEVCFTFEGRELRAPAGISLAAALCRAGEYALRKATPDNSRGVFCGIGVCQECRVEIDGIGWVRACMYPVVDSLQVRRASRLAVPPSDRETPPATIFAANTTPDILVIGAGPGGLTAAAVAAESGADVVLLDERGGGGGQYYKQPLSPEYTHRSLLDDRQTLAGRRLLERVRASGARIVARAEVWGAFAPGEYAVLVGDATAVFKPKCTIVATGAFERGLPLPGWTLPGVMTGGAAQTMLKSFGTLPGRRILVAGNGPLNFQVALELSRGGADVVALTELAPSPVKRPLAATAMLWRDPPLSLLGLRTIAALRSRGIPLLYRQGIASVAATSDGLRVRTGPFDNGRVRPDASHDVDVVCMGYGFSPNNEILRCLGCTHDYDEAAGHLVVTRNADCETSLPGIYAVGDCCGLRGAKAALEEGMIAAVAAIRSLSVAPSGDALRTAARGRRRLKRHLSFQAALWQLFSAPQLQTELAEPDTVVCRCENVQLSDVRRLVAEGVSSIDELKRRSRAGMGACQGRYCTPAVVQMLATEQGTTPDAYSFFIPRVPIKPVKISDIVAGTGEDS